MVGIKSSNLLLLVIGFLGPNYCYGLPGITDRPTSETESQDEYVPFMTTLEPIESSDNKKESCTFHDNCEDCYLFNCTWVRCLNKESSCLDVSVEMCPEISCNSTTEAPIPPKPTTTSPLMTTTIVPSNETTTQYIKTTSTTDSTITTTTTLVPTTNSTTESTTTPKTTTTSPLTTTTTSTTSEKTTAPVTEVTTESTTTTNSTSAPTPTTPIPTEVPSTHVPPTSTPAPHSRHFDAASFVGGMILVVALAGLGFGGYYYYRKSPLARNYSTF